MKIARVALAVPAIALIAACGAAATTASDDKPAPASSLNAGTATGRNAGSGSSGIDSAADSDLKALSPGAPVQANLADSLDALGTASSTAGSGEAQTPATDSPAQERAVISKGQVSLHTKDVDGARFKLKQDLDKWGGTISSEESSADKKGNTRLQSLVLRVPSDKFDTAMDTISGLDGTTLVDRSRTSQDVTTKVIDNAARLRTQKLSLARVQALLAQADSLNQIISIESQLSRRQATLDSLESQQKYLADQTSQATISVYLSVPDKKHEAHAKKKAHDDGFIAGLRGGWNNLGDATNTVLHAVGGLLPFSAVVLVLAVPVWLARRRRSVPTQA